MGCRNFGINQIMVGLYRVGITGLSDALKEAEDSGRAGKQAVVDFLVETLARDNYIPDAQKEAYRTALWREYLRHKGEDVSPAFSEVDVVVRGRPGEELDRFLETVSSVFGDFELRPVVTMQPPPESGPAFQLEVNGDIIVRGFPDRTRFKAAVQKSFSDW